MSYLPHIEKAAHAARTINEPVAGVIDAIGNLRGAFMVSGGGSEVMMESAIRHAEHARKWIGVVLEELRAAQQGMTPLVISPPSSNAQREDVAAGVAELISFAASGGPVRGPRLVHTSTPPIRDYAPDDGPEAA